MVRLDHTFLVSDTTQRDKGIHVKADGEGKNVVYGFSYHSKSSDGFLALPCNNLGLDEYEYYGMTYPREKYESQILIIGCEDNTQITVQSSSQKFILNQFETYLTSKSDTTGLRIASTKPISFFSNHQCTFIPQTIHACDHLTEQIPPTSTWGNSFFVASLLNRTSGEIIRIIAAKNSTSVDVYCTDKPVKKVFLGAGNWTEENISINSFCSIQSSAPVLVTQFALGCRANFVENNRTGDPFMMMIPPVDQYSNNYVFHSSHKFSNNCITIYVTTEYYQTDKIIIDTESSSQRNLIWTPVYCSANHICGYITRVSLLAGDHKVFHQDLNARIGVSMYGFHKRNSYGYPGGLKKAKSK